MIKVAAVQRCSNGTKEFNINETVSLIRKACSEHPGLDLIVFPEDNNAFEPTHEEALASAETLDGPYITALRKVAAELKVNVHTGSFTEKASDGRVRNTLAIIGRDGNICGTYSKIHLADMMGFKESACVEPGSKLGLIETDIGKIGVMICYDMRFPELGRSLALAGADYIVACSLWPCGAPLPQRIDHYNILARATAIQNLCYVVACNQYGEVGGERPFGESCIIDPWGNVMTHAGEGTQIIYAEFDPEYQKKVRAGIATWENRRPELYL